MGEPLVIAAPPKDHPTATGGTGGAVAGVPLTLADRLRQKYDGVVSQGTEEFGLPGWEGDLVARCVFVEDREEWAETTRATDTDAAFIARAVVGLLMRDDTGSLVELVDERGPILFDDRLAAILGSDAKTTTAVVYAVLRNPVRVTAFATTLINWMAGKGADGEAAILPI